MRLEQRAVFCRSLQVSVSLLSPRPPLNNKPLIHNGLAVFFYAFFPENSQISGKNWGKNTGVL